MQPHGEIARADARQPVVGDHLPRDAPDHEPATFVGPAGVHRGVRLEDAANPAGERIIIARRRDEPHRPHGASHKEARDHGPSPPREPEFLAHCERRQHRSRCAPGEPHIGRPRLQKQQHATGHHRRRNRRPPPGPAKRHRAEKAEGQGQAQEVGKEVDVGHQPHHGLHRVAAVDAETVLREQLPPADPAIGKRRHDRDLRHRFLPAGNERQKQAGDAEHEKSGERLEDVGEAGRDIEREEERDRRDRGIGGVTEHERVAKDRRIERPSRNLPRQHRHERQRHEEHRQKRQQPRDQRLVIDAHIAHKPQPDEQEPKERVKKYPS